MDNDGMMNFYNIIAMKYVIAFNTYIPHAVLIRGMMIGVLLLAMRVILHIRV